MRVEFQHIHKWFGRVHANDDISLTVPSGIVQGILGENGAGKSTLMKILSGFIRADSGQILLDGKPARIESPADAIRQGVGMLHQDPLDFPAMRVADNLLIGAPRGLIPRRDEAVEGLLRIQKDLDFSIDPDAYVDTLTVGERQQLELVRLLWMGANVLILDEPTTGISANQKTKLFRALRWLVEQGKTVLFVTHKLREVEELCDRAAILRHGRLVGELEPPYRRSDFIELMFGRPVEIPERQTVEVGPPILRLRGVRAEEGRLHVGPLDLDVHAGEIIGLAGMEGSGQDVLLRLIGGLVRPVAGTIEVNDMRLESASYHKHLRCNIRYVPADRMKEGLVAGLTLADHFALTGDGGSMFVEQRTVEQLAQERIKRFSIRGTPTSPVEALSGGNQQRALIACLGSAISVLLLEHPTRGLDMESSIWIWTTLRERARRDGTAILFMSSDLEEILQYSDRILVFFGGQISAPLEARSTNVDQLGQLIGGLEPQVSVP